jgi:hypothetical protein
MPTRQEVLVFLTQRNGATNNEVAKQFNIPAKRAACYTKQYHDKGYVTRKVTGHSVSGREIFTYYTFADVKGESGKFIPKQERLSAVRKRQDNDKGDGISELIQGLSTAIAKQIAAQVVVELQSSLPRELASVIPPVAPVPKVDLLSLLPVPVVTTHKPSLGIVGLLPVQQECISKEFGDVFDLRFWKDESISSLKAMGRSCDLVLVTKWCGHSDTETLSSVGSKWRRVDGGLSQLKDVLTTLYVGATQ